MELTSAIEERRSIREYLDKDVSKDDIVSIIKAGILAPSAKNKQPWEFIVIEDRTFKNEIGDLLYNSDERKSPSLIKTVDIIKKAPVLILVFSNILDDEYDWYSLSIGASIENMILKATDLGLGSLWIGYLNRAREEINNFLNITDKKLMAGIVIGYKNENPIARPRKNMEDVCVWR